MAVALPRRALHDLRRLSPEDRTQTLAGLHRIERGDPSLDVHPLRGHPQWLECRVGELRVLYQRRGDDWWVERIVHRQALMTAVRTL